MRTALSSARWVALARGVGVGWTTALLGATVAALATSFVSIQLRTPADRMIESPVLDTAVIVGLALPASVLARTAEDRAAWLLATGARAEWRIRTAWIGAVVVVGVVVAGLLAVLSPGQQPAVLLFADELLLLGAGVISAVLLSAALAWLVPVAVALLVSTPGLVPLSSNWMVRDDRSGHVLVLDAVVLLVAAVMFVRWDDYELARHRRLVARTPGVTDEG